MSARKEDHLITVKEAMFLACSLKHCKTKPDIDFEKLAVEMNYKNAASAIARYNKIKKKLEKVLFESNPTDSDQRTSVTTGTKRKADTTPSTNSKRARSDTGAAKAITNYTDEESGDEEKLGSEVKTYKHTDFATGTGEFELDEEVEAMVKAATTEALAGMRKMRKEMQAEDDAALKGELEY